MKRIEYKPYLENESHILLVEPDVILNIGDTHGEVATENDVWI